MLAVSWRCVTVIYDRYYDWGKVGKHRPARLGRVMNETHGVWRNQRANGANKSGYKEPCRANLHLNEIEWEYERVLFMGSSPRAIRYCFAH